MPTILQSQSKQASTFLKQGTDQTIVCSIAFRSLEEGRKKNKQLKKVEKNMSWIGDDAGTWWVAIFYGTLQRLVLQHMVSMGPSEWWTVSSHSSPGSEHPSVTIFFNLPSVKEENRLAYPHYWSHKKSSGTYPRID